MKQILPVYGIVEFSEHSEENYFYANELRNHLKSHQFINTPHKHSTYISILFTKGTGVHQIDFDTYPVKPGSVFLLNPGQVHCWKLSKDVQGFVFFHTKEFYDRIFINKKIDHYPFFYLQQNYPVVYLSSSDSKKIGNLFEEVYTEYKQKLALKQSKLGVVIDMIYIELARLYEQKGENKKNTSSDYLKVKQLQRLIDEHFRTKKFPTEYADLMNISARHLNRICSDVLNKSMGELITERVLIEAKRLLIQKNSTVLMVADELGFEDYSYFVRMFKKKVGVSPKVFQEKTKTPF